MPSASARLALATLLVSALSASTASAQLTVSFGSPPVVISDGGAGDACGTTDEVCFTGSLTFANYTIVGPCTTFLDVLPIGARMVLSDCAVIQDPPGAPSVVDITFDSGVFAALPAVDLEMVLDVIFTDTAPFSNESAVLDASTNLGPIGTTATLVPPPDNQTDVAGPTSFGPGVNQLIGTVTFELDNVGDRIELPASAQITSFGVAAPAPTVSGRGLAALGALLLAAALLAIRTRGNAAARART